MIQDDVLAEPRGNRVTGAVPVRPVLLLFGAFRLEGVNGTRTVPADEQRPPACLGLHKRATRTVLAGTLSSRPRRGP